MLTLSLAWCPKMLKLQVYTEAISDEEEIIEQGGLKEENTSRNRMAIITSLLKIFSTVLFSFGLNFWFDIADSRDPGESLRNGFEHFNDDVTMLYEFCFQVC